MVKPLADGRTAMLLYSSLGLLVAGCGEAQPWVALPQDRIAEAFASTGTDWWR